MQRYPVDEYNIMRMFHITEDALSGIWRWYVRKFFISAPYYWGCFVGSLTFIQGGGGIMEALIAVMYEQQRDIIWCFSCFMDFGWTVVRSLHIREDNYSGDMKRALWGDLCLTPCGLEYIYLSCAETHTLSWHVKLLGFRCSHTSFQLFL